MHLSPTGKVDLLKFLLGGQAPCKCNERKIANFVARGNLHPLLAATLLGLASLLLMLEQQPDAHPFQLHSRTPFRSTIGAIRHGLLKQDVLSTRTPVEKVRSLIWATLQSKL